MNKYETPINMGIVQNTPPEPKVNPITGQIEYAESMPNRAGAPNRSVSDLTAINSSYPLDPNKIPASQGTMTAKFGSIAKYMDDPMKKTGSPALNYSKPKLILDETMEDKNKIGQSISKIGSTVKQFESNITMLGDLDKNGVMSEYEQNRKDAIDKNMNT